MEKDFYSFSDTVALECKVDNTHCKKALSSIEVELKRYFTASNGNEHWYESTSLHKKSFIGIPAGSSEIIQLHVPLREVNISKASCGLKNWDKKQKKKHGENFGDAALYEFNAPSTTGEKV